MAFGGIRKCGVVGEEGGGDTDAVGVGGTRSSGGNGDGNGDDDSNIKDDENEGDGGVGGSAAVAVAAGRRQRKRGSAALAGSCSGNTLRISFCSCLHVINLLDTASKSSFAKSGLGKSDLFYIDDLRRQRDAFDYVGPSRRPYR